MALAAAEGEKRKTPLKARLPILLHLAEARWKQGKILEARQTGGAIMVTLRQNKSEVSAEYARCLDMLAKMHQQSGNLPGAQRLYTEALQIERVIKTPDPKNIAIRSQRLAAAHLRFRRARQRPARTHQTPLPRRRLPHAVREARVLEDAGGKRSNAAGELIVSLSAPLTRSAPSKILPMFTRMTPSADIIVVLRLLDTKSK